MASTSLHSRTCSLNGDWFPLSGYLPICRIRPSKQNLDSFSILGLSAFCFDPAWQKSVKAENEESTTKELFWINFEKFCGCFVVLTLISLIHFIENTTKNLLSIPKRKIIVNLCLPAGFQTYEIKNSREITVDVITFNKLPTHKQIDLL